MADLPAKTSLRHLLLQGLLPSIHRKREAHLWHVPLSGAEWSSMLPNEVVLGYLDLMRK